MSNSVNICIEYIKPREIVPTNACGKPKKMSKRNYPRRGCNYYKTNRNTAGSCRNFNALNSCQSNRCRH